jgi:hypothetical protein
MVIFGVSPIDRDAGSGARNRCLPQVFCNWSIAPSFASAKARCGTVEDRSGPCAVHSTRAMWRGGQTAPEKRDVVRRVRRADLFNSEQPAPVAQPTVSGESQIVVLPGPDGGARAAVGNRSSRLAVAARKPELSHQ